MAISISYPDKVLAGVWQSFTITSDEGPPTGEVLLAEKPLKARFIALRTPLWKVTFLLPGDSAGKSLTLKLQNAGGRLEESKPVEPSV